MLLFYLAAAGAFFAVEYSACYYIVNSVYLSNPMGMQRQYHAEWHVPYVVSYCMLVKMTTAFPVGMAQEFFGYHPHLFDSYRLSVNSMDVNPHNSYVPFSAPVCPVAIPYSGAYDMNLITLGFAIVNSTLIRELNVTGIQHLTLTASGTYQTNYYSQNVTRSVSIDCVFGPITGSPTQPPSLCGSG